MLRAVFYTEVENGFQMKCVYQHFKPLHVHCEFTVRHWKARTVLQRRASLLKVWLKGMTLIYAGSEPPAPLSSISSISTISCLLRVEVWEIKTH